MTNNDKALPGVEAGTGLRERKLPRHCTTAPTKHFLLDAIDLLNRACDELTFIGAGIGADLDANDGAHFLIQGVREKLSNLAQRAQDVVDDDEPEAPKPEPTPRPTVPPLTEKQRFLVETLRASFNDVGGPAHG